MKFSVCWYPCEVFEYNGEFYLRNIGKELFDKKEFDINSEKEFNNVIRDYMQEAYKKNNYMSLDLIFEEKKASNLLKELINSTNNLIKLTEIKTGVIHE